MRFFLQALEPFNKGFSGLFGKAEPGEDDGEPEVSSEETFTSRFGWIYNVKKVADFERQPLEWVWEMPILQFLNDLVYLKEEDAYNAKMIKDANRGVTE